MKITCLIAALLTASSLGAVPQQNASLLDESNRAYLSAQKLEARLKSRPETQRTRDEYLKVISAYERVYLITPHTSYADNSLMTMARLYEEIKDSANATKTLKFLLHEYPGTPFKDTAEKDLVRIAGVRPQKTAAVDNVRYWEGQNSVRIVVDVSGEVTFNKGDAKGPDRAFIDVSPARLNSALVGKQWKVDSGLLQQIRVGQYDASTVRIVLDVRGISRVTSFSLRDPDRLIIDVLGRQESAVQSIAETAAPSKAATPTVPAATGAAVPPVPSTPPVAAKATGANAIRKPGEVDPKIITPAKPPNAGKRSLVRSLGLKLSRVVIDAGHGGHDTGTIGPTGYMEKELVLDIAKRLKELIENSLGAEVVMTREDDTFVALENRTAVANQQQADLFISIHANSSSSPSVRGVETYFLNLTSSREALETASRENASSDRSIHDLQDIVKKIMLQDKMDESRELAQHIDRSLALRKGAGMDRGVKQAPFLVLIGANMPSVLAEVCFISNPQDEKLLKLPENRQAIADSLFEGVKSYAESLSGTKTAKTQEKTQE
jgi:N-acetylmuramoyl-L-alanine amidase